MRHLVDPLVVEGLEGLGFEREEVVANVRELGLHYREGCLFRSGKARIADKTPGISRFVAKLYEVFGPEVRFVYMVRRGIDVCDSIVDCGFFEDAFEGLNPTGRLLAAGHTWKTVNRKVRDFRETPSQVFFTVRYEELTARPEEMFRGVLDFLGKEWEPEILDYQAFVHDGAGDWRSEVEYAGIRPSESGSQRMRKEQRLALQSEPGEDLLAAGYDVDDLLEDPDPSDSEPSTPS
jgi:hypothetical protein